MDMEIVVVTGMSGAGKSSALNVFEDMGYYSMDNLPPKLIMSLLELTAMSESKIDRLALGMDMRGVGFLEDLSQAIENINKAGYQVSVLYLDSDDDVLISRFKEHRRPHPLDRTGNILDGISRERNALKTIKSKSDFVIDTSNIKGPELKSRIERLYGKKDGDQGDLAISIVSFGFKNGILLDADLVFDVRFLPNPHYIEDLKALTGQDQEVFSYVFSYDVTKEFLGKVFDLIDFSKPYYYQEGKRNLVIGIGCTGGKHRSVAFAEALGEKFREANNLVFISHRDEDKW